jgi:hypothetical protein
MKQQLSYSGAGVGRSLIGFGRVERVLLIMPPLLPSFRGRSIAWLVLSAVWVPTTLKAADGVSFSYPDAALGIFVAVVLGGLLVWLVSRGAQRKIEHRAAGTVHQITSLIEHADCLLWEARVELHGQEWKWEFTLHKSVLSQKLFGARLPCAGIGSLV